MALLKPFGNILNPKRIVPTGRLKIDWTHPLANRLLACYVPGVMGGINLANPGIGNLAFGTAAAIAVSKEGPGLSSSASYSGLTGTAPPGFLGSSQYSCYWRGFTLGNSDTNSQYIGISYDNSGSSPYVYIGMAPQSGGSTTSGSQYVYWNNGSFQNINGLPQATAGTLASYGATYNFGASYIAGYSGGKLYASQSGSAISATYAAAAQIGLNIQRASDSRYINAVAFIACIWNRALSAAEMALLDADPYGFLLPDEGEMPALYLASAGGGFKYSRAYIMG